MDRVALERQAALVDVRQRVCLEAVHVLPRLALAHRPLKGEERVARTRRGVAHAPRDGGVYVQGVAVPAERMRERSGPYVRLEDGRYAGLLDRTEGRQDCREPGLSCWGARGAGLWESAVRPAYLPSVGSASA